MGRARHRHRRGRRQRAGSRSSGTARPSSTCRRASVAHDGPMYERPYARPDWQDALQADDGADAAAAGDRRRSCARPCCALVGSPNLCDKSWVTDQYDRYVQGNTVLAQPSDAGMVRVDEEHRPRRRARHRRQRPLRASSTRTPARSSRWPRPTATSPSPARCRWPSPTASTSARPRTPT